MRILFAGNKERGVACLREIHSRRYEIVGVVAPPPIGSNSAPSTLAVEAAKLGFPVLQPESINHPKFVEELRGLRPDLGVLAGYGQIVKREFLNLFPLGCLNLHAGKLPEYRGSSPLNWALINGETQFTLSIIRVDEGVDTGDVLHERTFQISENDSIRDLHLISNLHFPVMLTDVLEGIQKETLEGRKQDASLAGYYPLRFPEDGLILWDLCTAKQIHNRIRALTDPYPGAFTFFNRLRVKLLRSALPERNYYGEPGRVYLKNRNGMLVCAADRCLWVQQAIFAKDLADASAAIQRYDKLATARDLAVASLLHESQ